MYDCSSNISIYDILVKPMEPLQKSALETMSSRVIQFISPFLELQYLRYIMIPRDLSLRLSGTYPLLGIAKETCKENFLYHFCNQFLQIGSHYLHWERLNAFSCLYIHPAVLDQLNLLYQYEASLSRIHHQVQQF